MERSLEIIMFVVEWQFANINQSKFKCKMLIEIDRCKTSVRKVVVNGFRIIRTGNLTSVPKNVAEVRQGTKTSN